MGFLRANRLQPDRCVILMIDMQEKLLPAILGSAEIIRAARHLLNGASIFKVPAVATEQYPKGIGPTHATIGEALTPLRAKVFEKSVFSVCGDEPTRAALRQLDRSQVVVAGVETHVCVQQTTLDLRAMDYDVFVCADAVGSRGSLDHTTGLERMRQAGAFITTVESVLFELCHECGTDQFKAMLEIIKANTDSYRF